MLMKNSISVLNRWHSSLMSDLMLCSKRFKPSILLKPTLKIRKIGLCFTTVLRILSWKIEPLYRCFPRTNNYVERWDRIFQELVGNKKDIHSIIEALKLVDLCSLSLKKAQGSNFVLIARKSCDEWYRYSILKCCLQFRFFTN